MMRREVLRHVRERRNRGDQVGAVTGRDRPASAVGRRIAWVWLLAGALSLLGSSAASAQSDDEGDGEPEAAETLTVNLSVYPDVAPEGGAASVTATLSGPAPRDMRVPLAVSGTAKASDHDRKLTGIRIREGATSGAANLFPKADNKDEPSETIVVSLGKKLPQGVVAGPRTSVEVTVIDKNPTTVTLQRIGKKGAIAEGSGFALLRIRLGRVLKAGEFLRVPLVISGKGVTSGDYELQRHTRNPWGLILDSTTGDVTIMGGADAGRNYFVRLIPVADGEAERVEKIQVTIPADGSDAESPLKRGIGIDGGYLGSGSASVTVRASRGAKQPVVAQESEDGEAQDDNDGEAPDGEAPDDEEAEEEVPSLPVAVTLTLEGDRTTLYEDFNSDGGWVSTTRMDSTRRLRRYNVYSSHANPRRRVTNIYQFHERLPMDGAVRVTTDRALKAGETLKVPLKVTGAGVDSSDYRLHLSGQPAGVTFKAKTNTLTFRGGPGVSTHARLRITAANDDLHEEAETLTVSVPASTSGSPALTATGISAAVTGSGSAQFRIWPSDAPRNNRPMAVVLERPEALHSRHGPLDAVVLWLRLSRPVLDHGQTMQVPLLIGGAGVNAADYNLQLVTGASHTHSGPTMRQTSVAVTSFEAQRGVTYDAASKTLTFQGGAGLWTPAEAFLIMTPANASATQGGGTVEVTIPENSESSATIKRPSWLTEVYGFGKIRIPVSDFSASSGAPPQLPYTNDPCAHPSNACGVNANASWWWDNTLSWWNKFTP